MEFRIADTFTGSLTKLTGDEQKAVKTAAFDLQLNPAQPSLQFHKLDKAKDRRFWSVRVSSDIRLIVHRTDASLLLCYVAHHDDAYHWAERRKLEIHPKTGAAQLVEVRETVQEIRIPKFVEVAQTGSPKTLLFAGVSEDMLLSYGVPTEWLADVRNANEDTLLELADHLPSEAAEALLDLATGVVPKASKPAVAGPIHLPIPTPSAASGPWPMLRNWSARSITPGTNGQSSFIRRSAHWLSATTTARRGWLARPAPARPSLLCIARSSWRGQTRTQECCSPLFPTRWRMR